MNLARSRLCHRMVVLRHPFTYLVHACSIEREVILREHHRELVAARRRLPLRQRVGLVRRHYAELSDTEIALTLGDTFSRRAPARQAALVSHAGSWRNLSADAGQG
jgi:hypothetical protein